MICKTVFKKKITFLPLLLPPNSNPEGGAGARIRPEREENANHILSPKVGS